jgi:hypothetical protein
MGEVGAFGCRQAARFLHLAEHGRDELGEPRLRHHAQKQFLLLGLLPHVGKVAMPGGELVHGDSPG